MHVPSLSMSNIVSNDNALSPVSDWDSNSHFSHSGVDALSAINFSNFSLPSPPLSMGSRMHSPMPTSKMLKSRLSPDASDSEHQLCVPTHQVFDVPPLPTDSAEEVEESILPQRDDCSRSSSPASVVPAKRPSSTATAPSKKARSGERITTKDFVPPDVTGLSKREARLVKNRAAAFLSRQRKREEFENMEVRVAELEQENARLQAITQGNNEGDHNEDLLSEVEQLRRQLAASKERERELSAELSRQSNPRSTAQPVKMETCESDIELPSRSGTPQPPNKSGASLGLMVLLCALPSLLSLQTHSALPTTFSLPLSGAASLPPSSTSFDMNSIIPNDYDWGFNTGSSIMDLDVDNKGRITGSSLSDPSTAATSNAKKLEFVDVDSEALGLSGLDISFDAKASQDGKIRVRIHPQATSSSTASSTAASSPAPHSESEDQLMYPGTDASGTTDSVSSSDHMLSSDYDPLGPFLGIGSNDYGFGSFSGMSVDSLDSLSSSSFDFRSSFDDGFGSSTSASSGRRRVRIALKSLPGQGSEGGEWEVQVC